MCFLCFFLIFDAISRVYITIYFPFCEHFFNIVKKMLKKKEISGIILELKRRI